MQDCLHIGLILDHSVIRQCRQGMGSPVTIPEANTLVELGWADRCHLPQRDPENVAKYLTGSWLDLRPAGAQPIRAGFEQQKCNIADRFNRHSF